MSYFKDDAVKERGAQPSWPTAAQLNGAQECGRVWNRPGNNKYSRTHYDGDQINKVGYEAPYGPDTRPWEKKWWNNDISSLQAYPGCWIAVYEDEGYGGYSSVCDAVNSAAKVSCEMGNILGTGALQQNTASSVRCFCNQPAPPTCGKLYHHSEEAPVIIKAGTKVPKLQRAEGQANRYFTAMKPTGGLNSHLEWTYDLDDAQVMRACSMDLYDEPSYQDTDQKSPISYNWSSGVGGWTYTGRYPNGRWQTFGTPDPNSNADYLIMHREHDVQSIKCSCNVWITGVKYTPDKSVSDFESGPVIQQESYPYMDGRNVIDGKMSDVKLPKTYQWINVLRDDYEVSINAANAGDFGYNFGNNRMAKIPAPYISELNNISTQFTFTRDDINKMNGSGTITRDDGDFLHTVTGVSCNYNSASQRCNIVFKKVPITGTVEVTWNRGDKTTAKFKAEHWFWTTQVESIGR